jgi:hypothetical protein
MLKGPGRSGRIFGLCLVSAFLLSLVLPSDANAWTRTITFESADIGTSAIDPDNPDLIFPGDTIVLPPVIQEDVDA